MTRTTNAKDWSIDEDNLLRELFDQKKSQAEIAEIIGRTMKGCEARRKRLGLMHTHHPLAVVTPALATAIRELAALNQSWGTIALTLGINPHTVAAFARRHKIRNTKPLPGIRFSNTALKPYKPPPQARATPAPSTAVPLAQLAAQQCAWPFGDKPRDMVFCAAPATQAAYCAHHAALSSQAGGRR